MSNEYLRLANFWGNIWERDPVPDEPVTSELCNERVERLKEAYASVAAKVDENEAETLNLIKDVRSELLIMRSDVSTVQREIAMLQQWKENGQTETGNSSKKNILWFSIVILVISIVSNLDKIAKILSNLVK